MAGHRSHYSSKTTPNKNRKNTSWVVVLNRNVAAAHATFAPQCIIRFMHDFWLRGRLPALFNVICYEGNSLNA